MPGFPQIQHHIRLFGLLSLAHHFQHAGDTFPRRFFDVISSVHHPLVTLAKRKIKFYI